MPTRFRGNCDNTDIYHSEGCTSLFVPQIKEVVIKEALKESGDVKRGYEI